MAFDIETFHERAVRTPSHTDEGVEAMRELLCETLREAGHEPRVDDHGTVIAVRGGGDGDLSGDGDRERNGDGDGGRHLVLNTHVDTVPPHVPYERTASPPGIHGDERAGASGETDVVRGRGACDAKGPLAALLAAFLRVDPGRGRVTLAITSDEETLQTGAAHLAEVLSADGYIVGEPTDLDVCIAARGQCEATITVRGESGHAASVPAERNAVLATGRVLETIRDYDERAGPGEDPVLGAPKLTPTVLAGGDASNRVPETCTITVDRRSVPPEKSDSFRDDLASVLAERLPDVDCEVALIRPDTPFPDPFVTDQDAPLVRTLAAASGGSIRPFEAATEASYFAPDAPTVVFGPGVLADEVGAVAHAEREYVRVADVERAADAVGETVRSFVR